MMRMGDLTLQPTPPIPPEIEGYLKKLKRKTRSLAGNWNKRWFFVNPRRREFGYADNRSSAPRSSIYLDDITAVVQFDDTHFQVESRTRNFFLCGESKASTACWVTSLEGYRKKLIEYEKDKIAYAAAAAAKASAAAAAQPPQPQPAAPTCQPSSKKKKSRDSSEADERHPANDSFDSSSSSSMSSTASSSKSKRGSGKTEYSPSDRLPPKSEQRSPSPLARDSRRSSSRKKRNRERHRERGRDRDRDRKFERESKRESSNDRDRSGCSDRERSGNSDRERSGHSDRDRSRDRNARAPSGRGSVMQAWVDDF
ncbi:hypothetical protein PHYSODRAFT_254262 [Phytophthora sojae]|uniref:PH domain-containing protein n=1 Tax=Phytophthora sojae (strain P6497) TaxID=1094619 RepID=G4Z1A9_PHYSP|nr:hypothetical protein PHYSODRAFT_254262 [Phytophthora sojae]EGZ24728.1 hypothetical protein PHYSODRAFT_254262 [Phytophthora sojae]|eukprot:XP_009520016.1 hypothetical protein PHYSODRAFT_254262 [Phytophthora sojae]